MFHATLLYEMQLLDEIPMLVASVVLIFCLIEIRSGHNAISFKGYIAAVVLFLYVAIATIVYLLIHDPTFHEVSYGILVFVLTVLGFHAIWRYADCRYLGMSCFSIGIYIFGFLLWNIDNHFCPPIRELRRTTLMSYAGFVTQLHAWWHIMTAIGFYLHIVISSRVRMELFGHQTSVKTCLGIPYLVVHRKKIH
jgi:dihydroceramidase